MYDFTVFIGRFQPPHRGHFSVIERALEKSDKLIILAGSCNRSLDVRNSFTFDERCDMLRNGIVELFGNAANDRVIILPLNDFVYNDFAWNLEVRRIVGNVAKYDKKENPSIALIGHSKDNSSYYLKEFPTWNSIEVPNWDNVSSTPIRNRILDTGVIMRESLLDTTYSFLYDWVVSENGLKLASEYALIKKIVSQWKNNDGTWKTPYPVIFSTVDAVVVQGGHVLMVERGAAPGEGLLALPGGYLNEYEKILDGTIRELKEETKIKIPIPVLKGCRVREKTYDDPYRSSRGRIITTATLFDLGNSNEISLPKVKGSDDARKAFWVPLDKLDPKEIFEDHYFIINDLLGKNG